MFGYIKPYKPEMKVKEFDTFQAIYCGLCKQLSHDYSPFASLTLSYDFTFIAAISSGLKEKCGGYKKCHCVANPLKKKACMIYSGDLNFCASTAILMTYYKIRDDIADAGFFKKVLCYILLPFASLMRRKAKKSYPDIDEVLSSTMREQASIERNSETSIDRAADPTAKALAVICEKLSEDAVQKRVLNRMGYLLGRYVYFADALDDLEDDIKSGNYNPFLSKFKGNESSIPEMKKYAEEVLSLTIGEIAPAYELLALNRYKTILDNIIYLGLHQEINKVLNESNQKNKKEQIYEQSL